MISLLRWLVKLSCLYFYTLCSYGQHPYEFKVTSENDNYCLRLHDGYYTNGLFVTLTYLPTGLNNRIDEASKQIKVTSHYRLGQLIFTPDYISPKLTIDQIDRPFAGYLFLEKGMTFFYKKGHVLKTSVSVGTLGKNSLAQQTQIFIHKTFDLLTTKGWDYQVKNEIGITAQGQYWHKLTSDSWRPAWLDLHAVAELIGGTLFTNASTGFLLQVGLFANESESSLYDVRVSRSTAPLKKNTEVYAFFHPSIEYQFYNATVQGGLLSNQGGAVVGPINRWVYTHSIGIGFSKPRWTFQTVYTYRQREAVRMRKDEQYAGLTAAYRFGK